MKIIKRVRGEWDCMDKAIVSWRYFNTLSTADYNKHIYFEVRLNITSKINFDFKFTKLK